MMCVHAVAGISRGLSGSINRVSHGFHIPIQVNGYLYTYFFACSFQTIKVGFIHLEISKETVC
jgi:hypothetical protein